jgi:hypothetical protein
MLHALPPTLPALGESFPFPSERDFILVSRIPCNQNTENSSLTVSSHAFSMKKIIKQTTTKQWRRSSSSSSPFSTSALRVPDAAAAAVSLPAVALCAACAPGPLLFALGAAAAALADAVLAAVAAFASRLAAAWPVLAFFAAAVAAGWASRGFAASSSSSSLESSSSRRLSESRRLREALAEHSETLAGIERGISVRKKREHTKKEPFQLARTS